MQKLVLKWFEVFHLSLISNKVFKMFEWSNQKLKPQNCFTFMANQNQIFFLNNSEIKFRDLFNKYK